MKIAVNTRLLVPNKMDGIGIFTYEVLKRISNNHPEHQFIFIFDRIPSIDFKFSGNVELKVLPPQARIPLLWTLWFQYLLPLFLKKNKAELFFSPEGWIPLSLTIPTLAVIHDLNFEHHPENIIKSHRNYLLKYFPKFAEKADRIATVSQFSKNDIATTYNIPSDKIDVVYNGVNEVFSPLSREEINLIQEKFSEGYNYFLFVGTIHPRKNLSKLFQAFEIFKTKTNSPFKLVIAGQKKWWPKELEKLYKKLTHHKDIIFTGRLDDKNLRNVIASAYALTYIPQFEGFGIPLLEAMKCEVPIITSNKSAMPEVAGEAAIYCNPFDEKDIADALENLYNNFTLREDLVNIGKQRVLNFSWDKTADLVWKSIEKTMDFK